MYRREVPVPVTITVLHERREALYYAVACLRALRAVQWGACVLLCVWWCVKRVQRREREELQDVRRYGRDVHSARYKTTHPCFRWAASNGQSSRPTVITSLNVP